MTLRQSQLLVLGLAVSLLVVGIAPVGAAPDDPVADDRSAFVVELTPEGDATVSLTLTYDLDDDTDEAAFDRLRDDPATVVERFDERLSRIADRTATETDREMSVSNVRADVTTDEATGVVELSASWSNLAAVDGDRLTVSEPFASEFRPDRPFVLVAPDGYVVSDTAVSTDGEGTAVVEWDGGTDLSGFSATVSPGDESTDAPADSAAAEDVNEESLPTPLAPALAALIAGLLAYRVRDRL